MRIIALLVLVASLLGGCTEVTSPGNSDRLLGQGRDFLLLVHHPKDVNVPFQTVLRTNHGPYVRPVLFVARSAAEWSAFHQQMLEAGAYRLSPLPPPPAEIDFGHGEAVLVVADLGSPLQILSVGRHGRQLRCRVDVDADHHLDEVEYSPMDGASFQGWNGLNGRIAIGADKVLAALQQLKLAP